MKHLIVCREYPPAPSGGIGTYAFHISRLLAEAGETVHVIGQCWAGAENPFEEKYNGRLVIHRLAVNDWTSLTGRKCSAAVDSREARSLFSSQYPAQCFSWQASKLAERLVESERIDVIEVQDFEAPLYFLQLRRQVGLGPKREPPCIVHLHSPTEFIVRHNDWELGDPYFLTAKRLEDYAIGSADALLCPSRYFASQAAAHYDLPPESIAVIPHPAGNTPLLERSSDIWRNGTIFYSGRLERRKGVIEWIEAAVSVALEYPDLQFDFVGANILEKDKLSSQRLLDSLIPEALRPRFRFHGSQPHALRTQFLARARIAVIPSRWENFPYTCIEAMSSGLPVIASREGGMAEMVTEGRSGWLSPEPAADALKATLVRALGTPATLLADMGRSAADDIRRICDNERILENHLRFRAEVAIRGAKRSLHLPCGRSGSARSSDKADQGALTKRLCGEGIAVVVIALNGGGLVRQSLQSLEEQTLKPVAIAVVCSENARGATEWVPYSQRHACFVITAAKRDGGVAKNSGIDAVLGAGISPRGFVFLTAGDTLKPGFVAACDAILRQFPNVGLVSCWIEHGARRQLFTGLLPAFPYQWLFNDVVPIAAIRTEALLEYGKFDPGFSHGFENWDLCNGIMVAGWTAITIPEVLGHWATGRGPRGFLLKTPSYWTMRREFLEKFSEAFSKDARDLLLLTESHITHSVWGDVVALRKKLALARVLLTNPLRAAAGVTKRLKYKLDRRRILQLWKLI